MSDQGRQQELPKRLPEELAMALRERASLLHGEYWELPATTAMMREAADMIAKLAASQSSSVGACQLIAKLQRWGAEYRREKPDYNNLPDEWVLGEALLEAASLLGGDVSARLHMREGDRVLSSPSTTGDTAGVTHPADNTSVGAGADVIARIVQEMRRNADDLAIMSDADNHNAQEAAKWIHKWADALASSGAPPQKDEDKQMTYYGPHDCEHCGAMVVKASREAGGQAFDPPPLLLRIFNRGSEAGNPEVAYPMEWTLHMCKETPNLAGPTRIVF